jgi:hypothetical protein
MHVCVYACMYVCMHVCICMYVFMYACMYVHMRMCACMYVCMHACMHVCMYVCMHACMYVRTYVCVYFHTHTAGETVPSHACSFENATSQHSTGVLHFLKVAMCSAKSPCAHASKSPGQRRTSPTRGDAGTRAAGGTRTRTRTRTPLHRALRPHATRDPARTRTPTRTCSASTPIRTGIACGFGRVQLHVTHELVSHFTTKQKPFCSKKGEEEEFKVAFGSRLPHTHHALRRRCAFDAGAARLRRLHRGAREYRPCARFALRWCLLLRRVRRAQHARRAASDEKPRPHGKGRTRGRRPRAETEREQGAAENPVSRPVGSVPAQRLSTVGGRAPCGRKDGARPPGRSASRGGWTQPGAQRAVRSRWRTHARESEWACAT